jgi:hypothetical protein
MGLRLPALAGVVRAPPPSSTVLGGQLATATAGVDAVVGPATLVITACVCVITLVVRHSAKDVVENDESTMAPLPPTASQCATSLATIPDMPVGSVLPSELGSVPLTWLPLDAAAVPIP